MTGPSGEFCFPKTSMFPEARPRGTFRVEGKQNSLFPEGPVIKCFVILPDSKLEKNWGKMINTAVTVPAVRAAVKPSCPTETTR